MSRSLFVLALIFGIACGKVNFDGLDATPGNAPVISAIDVGPGIVNVGGVLGATCMAQDSDGGELTFTWATSLGTIVGTTETVNLQAEFTDGDAMVTCTVEDETGRTDSETVVVTVSLPRTGLVAYYPFDGDGADASGNGNAIMLPDTGTGFVPNRLGAANQALHFDGTALLATAADADSELDLTTFTILVFATYEEATMTRAILGKGTAFGNYTFRVATGNSRGSYTHQVVGGNFGSSIGTAAVGTTFAHLAVTYDGTNLSTFFNGAPAGSLAGAPPVLNDSVVNIGGAPGQANWIGAIDEVRFYSRVLSADEIGAIANSTNH